MHRLQPVLGAAQAPGELTRARLRLKILEQCTQRLALGAAARRLYTADGMHVLHMEQLIQWAVDNFYKLQQVRAAAWTQFVFLARQILLPEWTEQLTCCVSFRQRREYKKLTTLKRKIL